MSSTVRLCRTPRISCPGSVPVPVPRVRQGRPNIPRKGIGSGDPRSSRFGPSRPLPLRVYSTVVPSVLVSLTRNFFLILEVTRHKKVCTRWRVTILGTSKIPRRFYQNLLGLRVYSFNRGKGKTTVGSLIRSLFPTEIEERS